MKPTIFEAAIGRLYRFFVENKDLSEPDQIKPLAIEAVKDLQVIFDDGNRLIGEEEIPVRFPFKQEYVRDKRYQGKGPSYFKFGNSRSSRVFYRVADIESWIEEHRIKIPHVAHRLIEG